MAKGKGMKALTDNDKELLGAAKESKKNYYFDSMALSDTLQKSLAFLQFEKPIPTTLVER